VFQKKLTVAMLWGAAAAAAPGVRGAEGTPPAPLPMQCPLPLGGISIELRGGLASGAFTLAPGAAKEKYKDVSPRDSGNSSSLGAQGGQA